MGRKRKGQQGSYLDIVSASYVRKSEYEKAQITYSNALDEHGNVKASKNSLFLGIEDEYTYDDDDVYD